MKNKFRELIKPAGWIGDPPTGGELHDTGYCLPKDPPQPYPLPKGARVFNTGPEGDHGYRSRQYMSAEILSGSSSAYGQVRNHDLQVKKMEC